MALHPLRNDIAKSKSKTEIIIRGKNVHNIRLFLLISNM